MIRLLMLASLVACSGCGNAVDRGQAGSAPTAHAEEVDGNGPFTRPAAEAFMAPDMVRDFAKEKAAAQVAAAHPGF
ncbi:MAG: hypothetical protein ACXWJJ_03000 [Ramlibacter sp.]